jgi:hypothetical protein
MIDGVVHKVIVKPRATVTTLHLHETSVPLDSRARDTIKGLLTGIGATTSPARARLGNAWGRGVQ